MTYSLNCMREGCHPFIFYHRVRPFLSGWKHNPTLPHGILYKGASNDRQQFYGGSAAQSSLLPFLDICLGIKHDLNKSREFLLAMRDYMLQPHRAFLVYLETTACIRQFVEQLIVKYHIHTPTCPLVPTTNNSNTNGVNTTNTTSSADVHIDTNAHGGGVGGDRCTGIDPAINSSNNDSDVMVMIITTI